MVEDTKMVVEETPMPPAAAPTPPPQEAAPLVAAALRLEKVLSDHIQLEYYTNPVKVVRRWLGSSSGAFQTVTSLLDIQAAAYELLSPDLEVVAEGRALLLQGYTPPSHKEKEGDTASPMTMQEETPVTTYVTMASAREVECWLFSCMIRFLWRQQRFSEAIQCAQPAIAICLQHIESSSALFPLLARLYRFYALAMESSHQTIPMATLSQAHNLATLRRDVDTQATLINIMLRDLLRNAQGTLLLLSALLSRTGFRFSCYYIVRSISHTHAQLLFDGSGTRTDLIVQHDFSRNSIQQSVLSLLILQWPRASLAIGVYRRLFQFESVCPQSTHRDWSGHSHRRPATPHCRAIVDGRNTGTTRL